VATLRWSLTIFLGVQRGTVKKTLSQNTWPLFGIKPDTSQIRFTFTAETRRSVAYEGLGRKLLQHISTSACHSGGTEKKHKILSTAGATGSNSIPLKYVSEDLDLNLSCSLVGLGRMPGWIPEPVGMW
jgi:hypothetical protein